MKTNKKHNWWIIISIVIILGLPIFLNFLIFTPANKFSAGRLQDWMSFWGSYLGAIISALAAFTILYIQRKDNKNQNEQNRFDNQIQNAKNRQYTHRENVLLAEKNRIENSKNRQLQIDVISYRQEIQWLSELRKALANYISAYRENDIKDIINSVSYSSFESVQQKIKDLCDILSRTETALGLVICENTRTKIGDSYNCYTSIIKDIQLLVCLYYNKIPVASDDSDKLNNLIIAMGINPKSFEYNQFSEVVNQLIKPLPSMFESIRSLCNRCIKDEKQRIDLSLKDSV